MRITDYEKNRNLRDISITLTREEAEDLAAYLNQLLKEPEVNRAWLSEIKGVKLEKEITIAVDGSHIAPFQAA
jgi:hypothetical protein